MQSSKPIFFFSSITCFKAWLCAVPFSLLDGTMMSPTALALSTLSTLQSRSTESNPNTKNKQRHHEQPLGIPGQAFTPSSPMELQPTSMLVTEVFVFKASASAWPKGKRLGSRSKLTSVRPHEIQRRHNSQFPTMSFQRTNPANVVYRGAFPTNIMPISQ